MRCRPSAKPPYAVWTALAATLIALALWGAQSVAPLRINHPALTVAECALLITAWTGLQIATIAPRYRWAEDLLVIWLALGTCTGPVHTRYDEVISHRHVYCACGIVAAAAAVAVGCVDGLLGAGMGFLYGMNFLLLNLVLMSAAAQLAAIRILGPQAGAFQAARLQAEVAAGATVGYDTVEDMFDLGDSGVHSRHPTR
jgi:hypothetical protein